MQLLLNDKTYSPSDIWTRCAKTNVSFTGASSEAAERERVKKHMECVQSEVKRTSIFLVYTVIMQIVFCVCIRLILFILFGCSFGAVLCFACLSHSPSFSVLLCVFVCFVYALILINVKYTKFACSRNVHGTHTNRFESIRILSRPE